MEIWKKIPGFENYMASDLGRIRNSKGEIMNLTLNGARTNNLYLAVSLQLKDLSLRWEKRKRTVKVHRLILMAFCGLPKEGQIGCHKNDVKIDNRLENLYWGTREDNAKDSILAGTFHFPHPGSNDNHHSAKYSNALIEQIRNEYTGKRGEQTALGKKYNISQQYLSAIFNEKVRKVEGRR